MKIGFIGLGIMGSRMAANLQKHGHTLVVYNRTQAKAQPLLDKGAGFAETPAQLAEQVDVLFSMLAHPDAVAQAALREKGFLNHLKANTVCRLQLGQSILLEENGGGRRSPAGPFRGRARDRLRARGHRGETRLLGRRRC